MTSWAVSSRDEGPSVLSPDVPPLGLTGAKRFHRPAEGPTQTVLKLRDEEGGEQGSPQAWGPRGKGIRLWEVPGVFR